MTKKPPTTIYDPLAKVAYVRFNGRTTEIRGCTLEQAERYAADLATRNNGTGLLYSAPSDCTIAPPPKRNH